MPVFAALVQGVAAGAIKGDPEQYRQFRAKMQRAADLEGIRATAADLTMKADAAVNLLQHHCSRVADYFQQQQAELKSVIELLVATFTDLAIGRPEQIRKLREIAQKVHEAPDAAALREIKGELTDCLTQIRQSAERGLHNGPQATVRDGATHLQGRPFAETALAEACSLSFPVCAAVLLLDRLPLYNQRYGKEIGDKTLRFLVEHLERTLACADSLFRWSANSLVMLRDGQPDKVQHEIRKVLEPRLQFDCEAGSRRLLLSVDATWSVLPMMVEPRMLINKIDAFVGA